MAPRHKASFGLKIILPRDFILNIKTDYVGRRYFINDQANAFSGLKSYVTVDTNLSYQYDDLKVTLSANNIFNEMYSEYGVISSEKAYYPACGRNFNIKMEYKF